MVIAANAAKSNKQNQTKLMFKVIIYNINTKSSNATQTVNIYCSHTPKQGKEGNDSQFIFKKRGATYYNIKSYYLYYVSCFIKVTENVTSASAITFRENRTGEFITRRR